MKYFLFFIVLSCVSSELVLVQEVYRHGARFPLFKGVLEIKEALEQSGELTPVGMKMHNILGRALRDEYIVKQQFLPSSFDHNLIHVQSTDLNRTLMSAMSQLLGLFPPGTGPNIGAKDGFPENLEFAPWPNAQDYDHTGDSAIPELLQPVPIHSTPQNLDTLLKGYSPQVCNMQYVWQKQNEESEDWKQYARDMNDTLLNFIQLFDLPSSYTLEDVRQQYDTLQCLKFNPDYFESIPSNLTEEMQVNMTYLYLQHQTMMMYQQDKEMRVVNTPFFKQMIINFDLSISKQSTLKWYMYSAHDSTVQQFLIGLNQTSWQCVRDHWETGTFNTPVCILEWPTFASNMLFELHVFDEKYQVALKYQGEYVRLCNQAEGEFFCDYDEFKERIENYVVEDFEKECQIPEDFEK